MRLLFIGYHDVGEREQELIEVLGNALGAEGTTVITSPRGAANEAIIRGVERVDGEVIKRNGGQDGLRLLLD